MEQLKNNEFSKVIQLLNKEKIHYTFAYSVAEGKQPGKIYVDNSIEPKSCLITCRSGKYLVLGDTTNTSFNEFITQYLCTKDNHIGYFDIYSSSNEWIIKLDEILEDTAAKLSRQLFRFDHFNISSILKWSEKLPKGFEFKRMDATLFEKYTREMDSSYSDLWESPDDFLSEGFGFCIMKDNEFVSVCNTYYVRQGFAEIDIVTNDDFRKQGFGLIICSKFIDYCIQNNIEPVWDCDNGNENSKILANKLGFKNVDTYQMHWWHENKNLVESYLNNFNYIF